MSIQARQQLVDRLQFSDPCERDDLLSPERTQTQLVALLLDVVNRLPEGVELKLTSVHCDHHDDSALGLHSHANGYAADCWPVDGSGWLDANDARFRGFLEAAASSSYLHQVGLAGTAATPANAAAAGPTAFLDEGADHVHLGAA